MNKRALFDEVLAVFEMEIQKMEKVLSSTHDMINDAPGPSQSHSDTTRFQESVVVEDQTKSLAERKRAAQNIRQMIAFGITTHDEIGIGSVVELEDEVDPVRFVILSEGGGDTISFQGQEYSITTPNAPLTQQLLGKRAGADALIGRGRKQRRVIVKAVY